MASWAVAALVGQATVPGLEPWPVWSGFVIGALGALLIELLRFHEMYGKMRLSRFNAAIRSPKLYILAGILITVGAITAGIYDLDQRRSSLPPSALPGPFQLLLFGAGAPAILRQGIASAVGKRDRDFGRAPGGAASDAFPAAAEPSITFAELVL